MKEWIKKHLGPAFVILEVIKTHLGVVFVFWEAIMHIYLAVYLTINWTNWPIWLFTIFELSMFIFLLVENKQRSNKK